MISLRFENEKIWCEINDKLKTGKLRLRKGESSTVAQWDGTAWTDNETPQYYLEVVS